MITLSVSTMPKRVSFMVLLVFWVMFWQLPISVTGSEMSEGWSASVLLHKERTEVAEVTRATTQRAPAAHIGSVMAILGTFHEAGVLPSEHDPEANQLIHTLIQLQSVVLKSQNPAIHEWVLSSLQVKSGGSVEHVREDLRRTGLTMESLEAFVAYGQISSPWDRPELSDGFHQYNVRQEHWRLLQKILVTAREQLRARGETLTQVFARQRAEMPGAAR
ncbi:MAG: hypothetical protein NPIRA04_17750 [Nitrospirales bacterium]|nr:MAG: hypothetical protein NPIRA04_17750 [Nitrospirales bacterium]